MKKILAALAITLSFSFLNVRAADAPQEPADTFDRLDGTGPSHAKVDVIEWENNLEIHVYPKGMLKGIGMKLDHETKGKSVMIIAYRLSTVPYTLTRRAIMGLPIHDGFKAFKATNEDEFDKLFITNNTINDGVVPFKLDAQPKQAYPDHYGEPEKKSVIGKDDGKPGKPAKQVQQSQDDADPEEGRGPAAKGGPDADGAIKGFSF